MLNDEEADFEPEIDENFAHVPEEVIDFISAFFDIVAHKIQSDEGRHLFELGKVNLAFHPSLPKTNCVFEFKYGNISYSIIYTDYKIELSDYQNMDTGFGYDHYQSFKYCFYSNGKSECEGDFDEFRNSIIETVSNLKELDPSSEE